MSSSPQQPTAPPKHSSSRRQRKHPLSTRILRALDAHKRSIAIGVLAVAVGAGGAAYYRAITHTPEAYLAKAIAAEQRGNRTAAEIELKNVLQLAPGHSEARFRLGTLHFANNDFPSAEKELRQALELGHADPDLRVMLTRTLLALREPARAQQETEVTADLPAPQQAALFALRAQAALMQGDTAGAEQALAQADQHVPDHPDSLAARAILAVNEKQPPEQALALIQRALTQDERRADLWLMKADLLRLARRDGAEALATYAKVLALEPANIPARLATVQLVLQGGDLDRAEAELKHISRHAPNNLLGRYLAALIDFRRGRPDDAYNKLQSVLNAAPQYLQANLLAGVISLTQDKRELAASHLGKVLDQAPDHALARKLLSASLLSAGKVDEAKAVVDQLGRDDHDALLLSLQGNIALRQGDYQAARRDLEKAAQLVPENPALLRELAASRMGSGDEQGAVEALTRMAEMDAGSNQAEVLLVITHLRAKRHDDALKVIGDLEKKQPGKPLIHNLRGIVLAANNDLAKARDSFQQALKIDPRYFPAAANLASLDLANKDFKTARGRFEQVAKQAPTDSRPWLALAQLARADNNEAEYLANLEKAARANPKDAQARMLLARYWLGRREPGKAMAEARAGMDASGMVEFLDIIGNAHAVQGDQQSALAAYSKWAETKPDQPLAHFRVAQAHSALKNPAAALVALDKALALKPDFTDAAVTKALLLGQLGRRDEAIALARAVQGREPKSAAGYIAEAEVRMAARQFAEAAPLYMKAANQSGQGQPLLGAYRAYVHAGQAKEGENALRRWLQAQPKDTQVRHQLAQALLNAGQLREAAEQFATVVREAPRDVVALNNLAWIYGELKDGRALTMAEQAFKLSPEHPAVMDTLGWLLVEQGQSKRGIELIRGALAKAPESMDIRWHLALALDKSGDKVGALQEIDRLLASGTPFSQEAEARALLNRLSSTRSQ